MKNKDWLNKLKPLAGNVTQWRAYEDMLDYYIALHIKKLEQATDTVDIYRAQGAIHSLQKLKTLRDEINGPNASI
jgi:hypothetical protein